MSDESYARACSYWNGVVQVPLQPPVDGPGFDGAGFDGAGFDGAGFDGAGVDGAGVDGAGLLGAELDGEDVGGEEVDGEVGVLEPDGVLEPAAAGGAGGPARLSVPSTWTRIPVGVNACVAPSSVLLESLTPPT